MTTQVDRAREVNFMKIKHLKGTVESVDTETKKVKISVKGESGLYLQEYTTDDDKVLKKLGDSVGYDIDFVEKDGKLDEIFSLSRPM
jgi:hypothetical protein